MLKILHLTDFHLNNKTLTDWNDFLKDALFEKIEEFQKEKSIDLVVFTGDLIDKAGSDFGSVTCGLNSFKDNIIDPILEKLNLDITRFIICPGNHDINRNADESYEDEGLISHLNSIDRINKFINDREDSNGAIKRIEEYKKFEYDLYKSILNKEHSKFTFSSKVDIDGRLIGIASINSSWRCYGDTDKNNILIGEKQLTKNTKFINDCDIKIALLHHPLEWLADVESKIIKAHLSADYDFIFTGHTHDTNFEMVQSLSGTNLRITSPSGLNQIRQNDTNYMNGFTLLECHENSCKCHFLKYNHSLKSFVDNTDVCDKGVKLIDVKKSNSTIVQDHNLILEDDFNDFLNDSGANFTHRSKTLTLDDIYVAPFMEQFSLNEEDEKGSTTKSETVLDKITSKEIKHVIILGEENSGKTSFCKQVFKHTYKAENTVPVFIKGYDIKKVTIEEINKIILKGIKSQYRENPNLQTNDLCIIIDDFDNCKLPLKSKRTFIVNLQSLNCQTVITWNEYFTLSELLESQVTTVEVYEILKFGGRKRLELIRKWVDLFEEEYEDDQSKEFEIKELSKTINVVIGKNLIPSLPIYILTILQANELSGTPNFEQSTFGHYYDVLIRSALGQKLKINAEIEKYYSYLSEFSYWLFKHKTIEIDEDQFIEFHGDFTKKYRVKLSFRDAACTLEDSNLIQKNYDSYKFKYKYIYFYFIGKYFSDNVDDESIKDEISELSKKLYQTESANIYIFLSHHSKSKFIINQIIDRAKESFNDETVIGFNSDIDTINNLILETAGRIELDQDITSTESDENDNISHHEPEDSSSEDSIDSISRINKAFKTIEILGYIIKNRYASLTGTNKTELIEELYKLGLRSLTFIFKTLLDGEEYIKNEIIDLIKKDPNSALTTREREDMAKQLMFNLLYMVSYSIFKRISSSISSKDLEITFADVKKKLATSVEGEKNNAISLIDIAIVFEYSKSFPETSVLKLTDELKGNPLAFNILKRLGINFMRMIPMKENEQQKVTNILKIPIKNQRVITATSKIKK